MPPSIQDYCQRLANVVIDPGTLRNQGAKGVAKAARHFLVKLDLAGFIQDNEADFCKQLEKQTNQLCQSLPVGAQNWGAARKAINLFLEEAYYHRFVCEYYGLDKIKEYLEVPLDWQVATYLMKQAQKAKEIELPRWDSIKRLKREESRKYQDFARVLAKSQGKDYLRIHIDLVWQRE